MYPTLDPVENGSLSLSLNVCNLNAVLDQATTAIYKT